MTFSETILASGQTFTLVDVYKNARGFQEALYYNPNGIYSCFITIKGDFISASI
jgi:hypothetical protein